MKKKNCSGTKGYNCGQTCISKSYECKIEVSGQSISIVNKLTTTIQATKSTKPGSKSTTKSKSKSNDGYKAPVLYDEARKAIRKQLVDKYFGGDEKKAKEFESKVTESLKDTTPQLYINRSTIDKIKKGDGRLKNIHEVSGDPNDFILESRRQIEDKRFGFKNKDLKDAAKYGFLEDEGPGASGYGDTLLKAKPGSISDDKTTVTIGDSLNYLLYSSPKNDIKIESFNKSILEDMVESGSTDLVEQSKKEGGLKGGYIETQIFGDLYLEDFDEVN